MPTNNIYGWDNTGKPVTRSTAGLPANLNTVAVGANLATVLAKVNELVAAVNAMLTVLRG